MGLLFSIVSLFCNYLPTVASALLPASHPCGQLSFWDGYTLLTPQKLGLKEGWGFS
jgi:hypothetical protein